MNHFRHVTPNSTHGDPTPRRLEHIRQETIELAQDDEPLFEVLSDANNLADAAMTAYRGSFPIEMPYFACSAISLPWRDEYWKSTGEGTMSPRTIPKAEIMKITDLLCGNDLYPTDPPRQYVFANAYACSDKLLVQIFAIEIVLCLNGSIEHLVRRHGAKSLQWSTAAYHNLFDLTMWVSQKYLELCNPRDADKGRLSLRQ